MRARVAAIGGRLRVAVLGYGTAGQSTAYLLSRDGHAVEVFERAATLGPVGAGSFVLHRGAIRVVGEGGPVVTGAAEA